MNPRANHNWDNYIQKSSGSTMLDQDRESSVFNQLVAVYNTGTPIDVDYDAGGHLILAPAGGNWSTLLGLIYDA